MANRRARGEGSVFESPQGSRRWWAKLSYVDDGGRRRRPRTGPHPSEAAAIKARAQLHRDRDAGRGMGTPGRQTLAHYLDAWLEDVVAPTLRPKTIESYRDACRLWIKPHIGAVQLEDLSPQHVRRCLNALATRGLGHETIKKARAVLRRALEQAVEDELIARNPAASVKVPQPKDEHGKVRQQSGRSSLSPDQARQFRTHLQATEARLRALYSTTIALGLRRGEVLGLAWSDLTTDADAGTATLGVFHQLQYGTRAPTKTRGRAVSIPAFLQDELREHRLRQLAERRLAGELWDEHGLIFTTRRGRPLGPRNVVRDFKKQLTAAELPEVRFHDLRRTTASFLAAMGVHQRTAMEILGHASSAMTTDVYTDVMPGLLQEAAARMDSLLAPAPADPAPEPFGDELGS